MSVKIDFMVSTEKFDQVQVPFPQFQSTLSWVPRK